MTTYTETTKAYQGVSTPVRVRVFNKYDYSTVIAKDTTINETDLKDYDGFSGVTTPVFDDAKATVDLSDTILPWKWNYKNKLTTSKFAIANYGTTVTQDKYVYNETSETWDKDKTFTVVGSPTIDENFVASGFSENNYLKRDNVTLGSVFDVYLKFTTSATTQSGGQKIFSLGDQTDEGNKYIFFSAANAGTSIYLRFTNGSSEKFYTSTTYGISNNTTYYIRFGSDGTNCYMYCSTTGYDNMTLFYSSVASVDMPSATFYLGFEPYAGKSFFKGSIDLANSYITKNGDEVWKGDYVTETLTGCVKGWVNDDPNSALNNEFQVYAIGDERVELYSKILRTSPSVVYRPIFTTPYGTFRYLGNVTVDIQSLPVKYYAWSYTTAGDVTTTVYTLSSTPSANDSVYTYNSTYNSMTQTETTITSVGDGSITVGSGFYAITYNRALLKDKTLYNF